MEWICQPIKRCGDKRTQRMKCQPKGVSKDRGRLDTLKEKKKGRGEIEDAKFKNSCEGTDKRYIV